MASLRYSQIRAHPGGTIHYIANKDKMISPKVHDVANVLNYMGTPESTERVYAYARHCSTNPDLAAQQMELYRARYYESKGGGVQGLKEGQCELLGLHFFLSYTEEDNPSEETMSDIISKLVEHPLLRDYAVFAAHHYDKTHRHTHFYACQYSAEGPPRKMAMQRKDYNDLRRFANRLCMGHSLSIIDLPALRRNDPEYSAWIDGVIATGKITVHPERQEHQGARRQKAATRQIYYKWLKDSEEFNAAEEQRLTRAQLASKKAAETFFWNFENNPQMPPYYISHDPKKRYYAVKKYDENGRKRSLVELTLMLLIVITRNESAILEYQEQTKNHVIHAHVHKEAQAMMDAIKLARELNAGTPAEVTAQIKDIGRQVNGIKKEKARLEDCVAHETRIIAIREKYDQLRDLVEVCNVTDPEILRQYHTASSELVREKVLSDEAFEQLQIRHQFRQRKLVDYRKRMTNLNRQYRGLKRLEPLISNPARIAVSIYSRNQELSLEHQIRAAEQEQPAKTNKQPSHGQLLKQ